MRSDEELEGTISVELEDDLMIYTMLEDQLIDEDSTRQAQLARKQILALFDSKPGVQMTAMVDLRPLAKANFLSDGAKQVYTSLMEHPQLKRLAFIVPNKLIQLLTGFMTQMSHRWDRVKWFSSEEKAREWLAEE